MKKKCASCWSFSQMCITMHGTENVKKKKSATGVEVSTHTAIYTLLIQKCTHKCTHACMHAGKQAVWSSHACICTSKEEN